MAKLFGKSIINIVKHPATRKAAEEFAAMLLAFAADRFAERRARQTSSDRGSGPVDPDDDVLATSDDDPGRATLREVEDEIFAVERVRVSLTHRASGRDARGDRRGFAHYSYVYKLSGDYTVSDLIRRRLIDYESRGLKPVVKYADNTQAQGGTRLSQVRSTYVG